MTKPLSDATYKRPPWPSKATTSGSTPTTEVPVTRQVFISTVSSAELMSQAMNASRAALSSARHYVLLHATTGWATVAPVARVAGATVAGRIR